MQTTTEVAPGLAVTIVAHDVGSVGGMERQLTELIGGLLADGVDVTVVARTCELDQHPRLRWVRVPGPSRPFVFAYPWFVLAGTLLVARRRRGVLHTTGAIVLNRADLSTVHLCHHSPGARKLRRRSRRSLLHLLNAIVAPFLARLGEQLCYRPSRTKQLVAVSHGIESELQAAFPRVPTRTISNAVDRRRFKPDPVARHTVRTSLGFANDTFICLFVGGEWEQKGLQIAIDAVRASPDAHLVVVGAGDSAQYASERVVFVGETREPERYYAAADAFVFPSAYEGAPLVVREAAAAGLPLLTTSISGIEDVVVDDVTGWTIERTPAAFAEHIAALQAEPRARQRLGAAARTRAERTGWPQVFDAYVTLYSELVATQPIPSRLDSSCDCSA
jgi:glycosyltransferase involved in cell wall biosynthesis